MEGYSELQVVKRRWSERHKAIELEMPVNGSMKENEVEKQRKPRVLPVS